MLRLLQLASASFPTGAYAYSQGLETVLAAGWVQSELECTSYLSSLCRHVLGGLELPVFFRLHEAIGEGDPVRTKATSHLLLACRESRELQEQDRQMARAVSRVLRSLKPELWPSEEPFTYAEAFAWSCHVYEIEQDCGALAFAYTWCEQHTSAAARLLPMGPLASQRVLDALIDGLPEVVAHARTIEDEGIGAGSPLLALACMTHETQYTRIFRS